MRQLAALPLAVLCALTLVSGASARSGVEPIGREFSGSVTAITAAAVTLRLGDGTALSCATTGMGANGGRDVRLWQLAPGDRALLLCASDDGGSTWWLSRAYPERGSAKVFTGTVVELTPSRIAVWTHAPNRIACSIPSGARFPGLSVGLQVKLTCTYTGSYTVSSVVPVPRAKPLKRLTITGTVLDLMGNKLLVQRIEGDGGGVGYTFVVPAALLAGVAAVATDGARVTVVGRPSGRSWLLVGITGA